MGKRIFDIITNKKLLLFIAMIAIGASLMIGLNNIATNHDENEHVQVEDSVDADSIERNDLVEEIDEAEPIENESEEEKEIKIKEKNLEEEIVEDTQEKEDESVSSGKSAEEEKAEQQKTDTPKTSEKTEVKEERPAEKRTEPKPKPKPQEPSKPKEQSKPTPKPNNQPQPDVVEEKPTPPTTPKKTAQLTIVGSQDVGTILRTVEVEITDSDTVLDVLQRVLRERNIQMDASGRGATAYVKGINNLYEFDRGPGSGWMYSVNGAFPNRSAGVWPVKQGEHIRWLYTVDLGKDLGAGQ